MRGWSLGPAVITAKSASGIVKPSRTKSAFDFGDFFGALADFAALGAAFRSGALAALVGPAETVGVLRAREGRLAATGATWAGLSADARAAAIGILRVVGIAVPDSK